MDVKEREGREREGQWRVYVREKGRGCDRAGRK